jgi:hypothetical protein
MGDKRIESSETDLLDDVEDAGKPKRRYSSLACYCCGTWSTIGIVAVILGIAAGVGYFKFWPMGDEFIDLAVGFASKEMCSAVFVSKRDPITLWNGEYKVAGPAIEAGIKVEIINDPPSVRHVSAAPLRLSNVLYAAHERQSHLL